MKTFSLFMLISIMLHGYGENAACVANEEQALKFNTPQIIIDTIDRILNNLPEERRKTIAAMESERNMARYHRGWGMGLRNSLGLWGDSELAQAFNQIGIYHADDMSGILMYSVWRRIHNEELNIEERVAYYQAYWEENKKLIDEPCPICSRILRHRLSFSLLYTTNPEIICKKLKRPDFPKVMKSVHWYRCPDGHEFIWTRERGLSDPSNAHIDVRKKLVESYPEIEEAFRW